MDAVDIRDTDLAARLKRLDATSGDTAPGFGYQDLWERQSAAKARARRRLGIARGTASGLVLAMVFGGVWRFVAPESRTENLEVASLTEAADASAVAEPRLVRADTYLALAALEDHIASIDDALSEARVIAPQGADVARLERTRAELMNSYTRVRYANMVSANF